MKSLLFSLFFSLVWATQVGAQTSTDIDNFIREIYTPTFDCPSAQHIPRLEQYLKSDALSKIQRHALTVDKTHWMICMGQYEDARALLQQLVNGNEMDYGRLPYASAVYQLGFIHDVHAEPERCEYYDKAKVLARDKFDDIYLSAQLGEITVCSDLKSEGENLGRLYALLEQYSTKGDKAAIAHIHNNIGLFYGTLGQQSLAGEQFMKAYNIGLDVYTGSNLLSTLISAISAQFASGDLEAASRSIENFRSINLKVNTPQTNVWLYFAESGYYYRTQEFDKLRTSLGKWKVFLDKMSSTTYSGLYRWYSAALCLHEQDRACLQNYLQTEAEAPQGFRDHVRKNRDYLKFQVDVQFFLQDHMQAEQEFNRYAALVKDNAEQQQSSGKVLGVAQLHNQISELESKVEQQSRQRQLVSVVLGTALAVIVIIIAWLLRRGNRTRLAIDPITGLHNASAVVDMIKAVPPPDVHSCNNLALFEVEEFTSINARYGVMASDLAMKELAEAITHVTRSKDIIGRLSANQFIVCLTNVEERQATKFIERIQQELDNVTIELNNGTSFSVHTLLSVYVTGQTFSDIHEVLYDMQQGVERQKKRKGVTATTAMAGSV